jgi:transcriptional regulator with XRE-family HTH domain
VREVSRVNESGLPTALRNGSPALFKRMIALSLRKWRLETGMPQKAAALRLDRTVQHISNLEAGQLPTASDLEILLAHYGKEDRIPFMRELLSSAKKARSWWTAMSGAVPKWFDLFLGLESGATELHSFDAVEVPGLLQTADYATAVLRGNPDLTDEQVAQRTRIRLGRQRILDRENEPVHLRTVLDESVLYRRRGDAGTMRAQLEHLLELSERPRIDLQVLPFDAGASPAEDGGTFVLMKFPHVLEGDAGLVYLELLTGGMYFEKPKEIARYQRVLTRLHALAADQKASRGIIGRAMKEVR